jgi:NADH-quinone oxidoreductase subunit J
MANNLILFIGLAIMAIASALGMLFSKSAIYSALFLIVNFGTIAVFYLLLDAPFIALTQITVYTGAIMVLFLFVIMLLGAEQVGQVATARWFRPLAILCGVTFLIETFTIIFSQLIQLPAVAEISPTFGSPTEVGLMLFNKYLLPFEMTSVLLLVAMIGAIVLIHNRNR